jgi:hypothetical protein
MRTVESLLTNAVKRFVGRICDLATTRAQRPQGRQSEAQALQAPERLAYRTMAQRKPVMRQQSKPRKNAWRSQMDVTLKTAKVRCR